MLAIMTLSATMGIAAPIVSPQMEIPLSTFDGARSTTQEWHEVNDPVMGGRSTGTFHVNRSAAVGVFEGDCKIVPSLKAPGFCNMQAERARFPDISEATALKLVVRSRLAYSGFKASFGPAPASGFFSSYKADFNVTVSDEWQTVIVPFDQFSDKWSSFTGEPTVRCSKDKKVCPDKEHLRKLNSMELSAEGVLGKFLLEVKSISAVTESPPGQTVCKSSEYCCPDAKHCLTPTNTSCVESGKCGAGEVCCPITKICVVAGAACQSPCADQGSYCCPDAKHCLTPTRPGHFCKADTECRGQEVCCPLTKLCVAVGAACTPPLPSFMAQH